MRDERRERGKTQPHPACTQREVRVYSETAVLRVSLYPSLQSLNKTSGYEDALPALHPCLPALSSPNHGEGDSTQLTALPQAEQRWGARGTGIRPPHLPSGIRE